MTIASLAVLLVIGSPPEPVTGDVVDSPAASSQASEAPAEGPAAAPAEPSADLVSPLREQPSEANSDASPDIVGQDDDHVDWPKLAGKPDGDAPDEAKPKGKDDKDKKVKFKFGARVIAGVAMVDQAAAVDSNGDVVGTPDRKARIELRQARLKFDLRYADILRIRASVELADLLGLPETGDVIRDAWANIRIHDAFQIKLGNFKRPYSRLELRGVSSIPMIGRGLYNSAAVERLSWGDRAVGLGLWGKITPERRGLHEFGWAVSVSNNALSGSPHGVDVHARVTYDPVEWLSIGLGGAYKHVQDPLANETACTDDWRRDPGCRRDVFGADADLVVRVKGLYASVEADLAQDWTFADTSPWMLGALAYASYDFEVGKRTRLQPVVSGEYVDTNLSFGQSEAVRTVGGLNVLWTKHLRVMPQAQVVVPLAPVTAFNQFNKEWLVGLWVQVQL
jgi:hypothetical protein